MALKENSQPRNPSGPVRDSTRYTTSPTTTEGTARAVFNNASTAVRPRKRATPSQAPSGRPRTQAIAQALALMDSDRPTMASKPGSREAMSCRAVEVLSERVVMGWGIVATEAISSDMKSHA
jgi:hypothetical protein